MNTPIICFVLQTTSGAHLGFVLCSFEGESRSGDCIFQVLPTDPQLFQSQLVEDLCHRKELGESQVKISSWEPYEVIINSPGLPSLFATWSDGATGTWGIDAHGVREVLGISFPCKQ